MCFFVSGAKPEYKHEDQYAGFEKPAPLDGVKNAKKMNMR